MLQSLTLKKTFVIMGIKEDRILSCLTPIERMGKKFFHKKIFL